MKVLSVCGSPRKGNSEAVVLRLKQIFERTGVENEVVLLREKNIERCDGCVEYCNKKLVCRKKDDTPEIFAKMKDCDGFVFVCPNYFKMPPGIFKDFIDRASVLYTAKTNLSNKPALVIVVGADEIKEIDVCLANIRDNFCKTLGIPVVVAKSFRSRSELNGNYDDIFENKLTPGIEKDLEKMAGQLVAAMKSA